MTFERGRLDAEALAMFADKGVIPGRSVAQAGEGNAVKVRRVMQLVADLVSPRFDALAWLDLGCAEGVYCIEAGLRGARVLGIDARSERLDRGAECASRHGLSNVRLVQGDARRISVQDTGTFDVVSCLGLLYHFDQHQVLPFLERAHAVCSRLFVVETIVTDEPDVTIEHAGRRYEARRWREHPDDASPAEKRRDLLKSIDNVSSVYFTCASLVRALHDVGFTSVFEVHAPPEPNKPKQRITLAALRGRRVIVETYPWVNGMTEEEVARRLGAPGD